MAIGLVVKFTSGPGPQKRFERIWINPAYRTAIAKLFKIENSTFPLESETIVLEASPDPSHQFDDVVAWLGEQGIRRRKAARELDFILRYLIDNRKLVCVAPPEIVNPVEHFGSGES